MAYATFADVAARFPPIQTMVSSDTTTDVTTAQVSSVYIADAAGLVDAYLGARYVTPLVTEPLITRITADLAIFKLGEDRLPRLPDYMEKRYASAIELLCMLRDGKMVLSSSQTIVVSGGDQTAWSSTDSYSPVFSPVLNELDQRVDPDYVTAEKDARDIAWTDCG